eukprot:CAMPEP_0206456000 /NCGR_PEP_ID=MMETSP0324_2-20121206/22110_1 /ASSEMBLY_ACC=CAM_ASM_000836 /TAXON_ID=2866 /ORGANISM="Crypthecodinium cohnii, Strain Seligo" /LENGTH=404 /DNA_ID=CAMNT_0053926857 /DNA_START=104 /DNA_END=1317 /DNA_ORIENTATION=+
MTPYLVKVPMLHWHLAVVLVAFLLLLEVAPGTALKAGEHDRGKHREQLRTVHHTKHRHHHSRHHQDSTMAVHSKGLAVTMNEETLAAANASAAQLDYWTDVQPVDTALGQFFVAGLQERPTSTPLPLQASLDVVRAGCPMMLTWPREVDVLAINPCDSQHIGVWRNHATNESLVEYYQSCSPFSGGLAPIATYTMAEGGHVLAETQMGVTMFGTRIHLMDCRGSTRYMIEEKVHHETKGRDQRSCEKFGSCDGVIWIQYLIYKDDELVAQTPFLHLFQSIVRIVDPTTGSNIAVAKRLGDWDPNIADCQGQRQWHLTYVPAEEMPAGALQQNNRTVADSCDDICDVFAGPTQETKRAPRNHLLQCLQGLSPVHLDHDLAGGLRCRISGLPQGRCASVACWPLGA